MKKIFNNLNVKEKIKNSMTGEETKKNLKHGSYTSVMTVIIIALVVVLNLVFGQLPSSSTQIDVSSQKLFSIGDETKDLVKNLEQDVTLYYIVRNGNENEYVSKMLEHYGDLSSHLRVEKIDPDLNPTFTSQYTDEAVEENSIIVVSGEKSRVVSIYDMLLQEFDYYTYNYQTTGFDGEGQVTSAIAYVISDELPVLYQLTGHNEVSMGSYLTDAIQKNNVELKDLSLLTEKNIPEDASALMICSPTKDLSDEETAKILNYLENGGKVILFTDYSRGDMTNLESILTNYGLRISDGIVMEGNGNYYYPQRPDVMFPEVNTDASLLSGLADDTYAMIQDAQAIQALDEYRDSLTIESILTTTGKGYVKQISDGKISLEKESGDEEGYFNVGISVTETIDEETAAQLVCFTSSSMVSDELDQYVYNGNTDILIRVMTNLCVMDENTAFSIPSKSFSVNYLNYTASTASIWKIVMIGVIPAAFLVIGFGIWLKRKNR